MRYSLIAKAYLEELDQKEPFVKHRMVTWGNCQMMEDLFILFGGDREEVFQRTGCIGHHSRYKYVMDRLDRESQKPDAIFAKGYIHYNGIINRPTRCFKLKRSDDITEETGKGN